MSYFNGSVHLLPDLKLHGLSEHRPGKGEGMILTVLPARVHIRRQRADELLVNVPADGSFVEVGVIHAADDGPKAELEEFADKLARIDLPNRENTAHSDASQIDTTAYGEFNRLNYIGNYLKPGPSTTQNPLLFHDGKAVVAPKSLFVADNILEDDKKVNQNNWRGMGYYYFDRDSLGTSEPFPAPPVTPEPPDDAYKVVLTNAGDTLPQRDAVDLRIVHEVRTGTGHIINWANQSGSEAEPAPSPVENPK
jgi:hypothetical protein